MRPDPAFWRGRRVLLTGHTGFKGAWLALWLQRLGAQVTGLALPPAGTPHLYGLAQVAQGMDSRYVDIRDAVATAEAIHAAQPEVVFHLAAQALVGEGYTHPLATFHTNVQGTAHVLDALRDQDSTRVAVVVTTDKVYRNLETPSPYRETDHLGGHDPYSASKAACELVVDSYRLSYLADQGVAVASARAGNVIGGGDWAPNRLVPDAVRAWQNQQTLVLRHPGSTRPWQHVLEPLWGYLLLAQRLWESPDLAGAWNLGPLPHEAATVGRVTALAQAAYGQGEVVVQTPSQLPHEAGWLALDTAKARHGLHLQPRWNLPTAVQRTLTWYRAQHRGADARDLCLQDITDFESAPPCDDWS